MRPGRSVLAGWLSLALGGSAFAQSPGAVVPPPAGPLAVPYLAQSELLCGGAAVAMVERWWGRRRVYAEDFAALVRPERGGIVTGELVEAVRRRGYDVQVFAGSPEEVRRHIEAGVPVVALIAVGRNRFHYVVVVSWHDGEVVFHDPAKAPGIRRPEAEFVADWRAAERWTMVMTPGAAAPPGGALKTAPEPAGLPCPPWLDQAADSAGTGAVGAAGRLLDEAARLCPGEPVVLRERAALRFRERRYAEAAALAEAYVGRVPADDHGWRLLAATRYLAGDPEGALDAWNRIGRPTVDLVRVDGLRRVRFGPVARTIPVSPGGTLTADRLALARRRMDELPALGGSAVEYRAVEGELVELDARVAERPLLGRPVPLLASGAVRAIAQDEARLDLVSPAGTGEVWTALWRWTSARPRVALRLEAPARVWIPGVAVVEGAWDRYRLPADSAHPLGFTQERRSAAFRFGAWITPAFRAGLGSRLDRWQGDTTFLASLAAVEARLARDRFTLLASGEYVTGLSSGTAYGIGSGLARWLSAPDLARSRWSVRAGLDVSSRSAPRGLWPVAGGEHWAIPLRAHGGTADGRLSARTTGRGVLHGGVEADHPLARLGPVIVAAGAFVEAARTLHPPAGMDGRLYMDGGFGLRIGGAGAGSRIIRIDLATGLTERVTALTARVEAR